MASSCFAMHITAIWLNNDFCSNRETEQKKINGYSPCNLYIIFNTILHIVTVLLIPNKNCLKLLAMICFFLFRIKTHGEL